MIVDPQPIVIRKKIGTSVRPRPRKREQSLSSSVTTTSSEMMDTTETMTQVSHRDSDARRKKLPTGSYHPITIDDYISHKPQPNFHQTLPTSVLSAVATSKAVDDAYDYLFKHLKGQCHGLNVITYPRVGKDGNAAQSESAADNNDINNTVTRFAILAYIQPGTIYRDWESIEEGLVRIFKEAAAKKDGGEEPKWHLEGVVFELWATKPMNWDIHSGHF